MFTVVKTLFFSLSEYEKIAISKDVVDAFIKNNLPDYKIYPVQGDGLCIFHAFSEGIFWLRGFRILVDEIMIALKDQLTSFKAYYSNFSESSVDIVEELDRIFQNPLANYDSDTTDLFLAALSDHYEVNVMVYQSNAEKCWIVNLSNINSPFAETLHFARTLSLHIDLVIRCAHEDVSKGRCFQGLFVK